MEFMVGSERAMVDFKIAYNQKTKPAVRKHLAKSSNTTITRSERLPRCSYWSSTKL